MDLKRLHLVRPSAALQPIEAMLAEDDTVVYIEPQPSRLRGRTPSNPDLLGPDELLELIFQHHAVITW